MLHILTTDTAFVSLEMPTIQMYDEADGTIEVCAVISGLPAEGLANDITVDFDVENGSAGEFNYTSLNVSCLCLST